MRRWVAMVMGGVCAAMWSVGCSSAEFKVDAPPEQSAEQQQQADQLGHLLQGAQPAPPEAAE